MTKFIHLALVISALCLFGSEVVAQAPSPGICNLSTAKAPQLWGFKLGMTFEEVKERYPSIRASESSYFGSRDAQVIADEDAKTQRNYQWLLTGVLFVNLSFVDEKLAYIGVAYRPGAISYPDAETYTASLSKSFGLPRAWELKPDTDNSAMEMKCGGVDFDAFASPSLAFLMFDSQAFGKLDKREKDYQNLQFKKFGN
jgi:hypothetical protein